ncbi:hypothetical protein [Microbacterium enclense]|uniref:hypothetical protein n=1 Tax=Microbacterium enclense TaxID=993073 RepID=UPI003D721488
MTLFEQQPRLPDRGPFAALERERRRRRAWMTALVVCTVLALTAGIVFGTGADRALIAQVGALVGPKTLPADIAAVADRAFLTDHGREILTEVGARSAAGDDLRSSCEREDTADDHAVAGCYSGAGIVVFVPTDARVADAAVTTLAHELLHAAFDRLGSGEVWRVRDQLHAAIERVPADDPVHQQIDWSVGEHDELRDTELFAYLGSQVWLEGGFDPALEAVYARFFTDRAGLVAVGHSVTAAVDGFIADYDNAVAQLTEAETDAVTQRAQLDADRQGYELDRASYQTDADRYNAMDPVERGRWRQDWQSSDGTSHSGTWEEALAARLADLDARHAELEARAVTMEGLVADAAARRAAIDAQFADVLAVTKALDPTASGS